MQKFFIFILSSIVLFSCKKNENYKFQLLSPEQTGIDFSNDLVPSKDLNIFNYMYFYNGGGVGAGDLNNDGLVDLCFTSNLKENKLYLNKGGLKFEDITQKSNFKSNKGWSTGVSIVDINQDGKLDIYISQVGDYVGLKGQNLLYVCQKITPEGIPVYEELSKEYGLDLRGFGTQAAFFDYDLDGDLDMFMLNHSVHSNGTFGARANFDGTFHPTAGDKLFMATKDGASSHSRYVEVTENSGIIGTVLGYGLGVCVGDVNLDGYPDMYIGNDFHENDYLYINQKNSNGSTPRFKEEINNQMTHTSQFSMGVDIADINNDAFPEIVSLDMLPSDPEILKRSEGDDAYNIFNYKLKQGYNYQFSRNNLQLNNGNGTFSEIGMFAGIHATDWSWASLFVDFDNDGYKDLFVSNGIAKRMNDIDYIKFASDEVIQEKIKEKKFDETDVSLVDKLPEIKLFNKFFSNQANLAFKDLEPEILDDKLSFSNGSVYADLDNDGDLDIITNNINEKAFVYENFANKNNPQNKSLTISLKGDVQNLNAIGTKCLVFKKDKTITYEKFPVRGFQSSMEIPLTVGLGNVTEIDSILLVWPNNTFQKLDKSTFAKNKIQVNFTANLPIFDYKTLVPKVKTVDFQNIAQQIGLEIKHEENNFVEFDREILIPNMMSTEGPALAVADINHDGLEDVFVGSARDFKSQILLQKPDGKFIKTKQPAIEKDSLYEDVDAIFVDVNADSHLDLVVATGGNEFFGKAQSLTQRLYLNDGKGNFMLKPDAFNGIYMTASSVKPIDIDADGKMDLFISGRAIPWDYGSIPRSYLLKNDGTGRFTDITATVAPELAQAGLVKNATFADMDKDGDQDLLLALEWDSITMFENNRGKFTKKALSKEKGWWNFTLPFDFDSDGDMDILVGNLGQNSRLKASSSQPIRMYVNDYDGNGKREQILTYYLNDKEIPFANKLEIDKQLPVTKKKYLLAKDFAKASIADIVGKDLLNSATLFEADYFSNAILVNDGKGNFTTKPLPTNAQFTPYNDAQIIDANGDALPDVLLMGNFYECNIQMGRYDADYGTILINRGNGDFEATQMNGLQVKGQVRRLKKIKIGKEDIILAVRNNDYLMAIRPALRKNQ